MSLFTHWVCFDCRKSFHKKPHDSTQKCPDCTQPMIDMGVYFEPPKRQALKRWKVMWLLAENGYKFQTEGSSWYIVKYIIGSKNPSFEGVREFIENREKAIKEEKINDRLKWEKKVWGKQK